MIKPIPPPTVQHVLPPNLDHEYFKDGGQHPFRHDAGDFELVNAWWLAEMALLSYAPKDFALQQLRGAGWTVDTDQPFEGASTLCYVAHSRDAVVVSFRGTQVLKPGGAPPSLAALRAVLADICTDGRVGLVDWERAGAVHRGFHAALEQIWTKLLACLTKLKAERPERTLWFTGHSLGAALATLAGDRFRDVQGVYTFGSPLVGDRSFAQDFPVSTFRVVNNNDVVPYVPRFGPCATAPLIRAYEHVGRLRYIATDGVVQDNPSRWSRLVDGFEGRHRHLLDLAGQLRSGSFGALPDDGFNDHAPLFYALRVWNAYAGRAIDTR